MKGTYCAPKALLSLLLLACDVQPRYGSVGVQAFVAPHCVSTSRRSINCLQYPSTLCAKDQDEDESTIKNTPGGIDRRGTLMNLLGTAASFAMGDVVLKAATGAAGTAVASASSGLYERVLAFGNQYRGSAIASEELTAWIATQNVAATPEITAWLAAQRKLQMARKATMAATTALSRGAKGAVVEGGGILEEGILAAAATAAVKAFSRTRSSGEEEDDLSSSTRAPIAEGVEASQREEGETLAPSSNIDEVEAVNAKNEHTSSRSSMVEKMNHNENNM